MTMSATTTHDTTPTTVTRRHPIRGLLWGLVFGIGLSAVLVLTTVIELDLVTMIAVAVAATAAGVAWGTFGPAKAPKGPPPTTALAVEQVPVTAVPAEVGDLAPDAPEHEAAPDGADGGD